jgi:hypothetical protein
MVDPLMGVLLKAGGLSLRELFVRVGPEFQTGRRLAGLLKTGDVRIESIGAESESQAMEQLGIKLNLSEEDIAGLLLQAYTQHPAVADSVEILPTSKAWRFSSQP